MYKLQLIVWLYVLLLLSTNAVRKFQKIKLDRLNCTSTMCESFNCVVTRKNSHTQIIDGFCNLSEPVEDVYSHSQLFYRYTRYVPFLYDVHADVCDFIGAANKFQPFIASLRNYLERYTRNVLNQTCPASGNISVVQLLVDMDIIKDTIVPTGQYRADTRIYIKSTNATIFHVQAYFSKLHEVRHTAG